MFNINAQAKLFNNTTAIEELSDEAAATIQGGLVILYRDGDFRNPLGASRTSARALGSMNDQISSIYIQKGEGQWGFYEHSEYGGASIIFGPGVHNLPSNWNDRISSFRRFPPR